MCFCSDPDNGRHDGIMKERVYMLQKGVSSAGALFHLVLLWFLCPCACVSWRMFEALDKPGW